MGRAYCVLVDATGHPERDEWVDDRAREEQSVLQLVPIDSAHYRGVWTTPMGSPVHLFAITGDLIKIEQQGGYRPPRCPDCGVRAFPQDGPGVHPALCPRGWARYGRCEECGARTGERCTKPGLWPHAGRPLVRFPVRPADRRGDRHAPLW